MFPELKHHNTLPVTCYYNMNTTDGGNDIVDKFVKADLDTKADIITKLWQTSPAESSRSSAMADMSDNFLLGALFYDDMHVIQQSYLVMPRIRESALQLFNAAVLRPIDYERVDNKIKARLSIIALSCIYRWDMAGKLSDLAKFGQDLEKFRQDLAHWLPIPEELAEIIPTNKLMEKAILDTAITLLARNKEGFYATPTLLYNPKDHKNPFNVACYLNEVSTLWQGHAEEKLKQLMPGQKLMIPIQSTTYNETAARATDGHFSAILAIRTATDYRFYIFDSNSSYGINDNKSVLISMLIGQQSKYSIDYFYKPFQYNNDCGIHTYNFFKFCMEAPGGAFEENRIMNNCFRNYVENLALCNLTLKEGNQATSHLLRIHFVLDCIINGYTPGLRDSKEMLMFYRPEGSDKPEEEERQDIRRSIALWNTLRSGIGNVFSPKRTARKTNVMSNDIPLKTWEATGRTALKNDEDNKKKPG